MDKQQIEEFLSGHEVEYLFNTTTFQVICYDPEDEDEPFASVGPEGDTLFSFFLEDTDTSCLSDTTWQHCYVWAGTDRPSTDMVMEALAHGDWQPLTRENVMRAWLETNKDEIKRLTGLTVEKRLDDAQYLIASAADVDLMLRSGQSLYNADDGETLIPDISLDDDGREVFRGVMTAYVSTKDAYVASSSAAEYARDTIPAPGSGAFGRMGFIGTYDEEYDRLCNDVAAHYGLMEWEVDSVVRISKLRTIEMGNEIALPEGGRREDMALDEGTAWAMPVINPTTEEILGTAVIETHAMEDEESPWGYSWSTQAVVSDQAGNTTELDGTMYWGPKSAEAAMLDSLVDLEMEYRPKFPDHALFNAAHRVSLPTEVFYQICNGGYVIVPCPTVSKDVPSTADTLAALDLADSQQIRDKYERTMKGLAH